MAGVALGAIYFGGLWWTVRRGLASRRPALWLSGSLLLRAGMALAGFYFVGQGHWQRLVACLLGFVMARLAATWRMRPPEHKPSRGAGEASHAP